MHLSTVSLAMRNNPRIPAKTRTRIKAIAEEMGYVPDPAMSALCSYRDSIRSHEVQSGLAYLTDMSAQDKFSTMVYEHAKEQAQARGYNLISYNLTDENITLKRLQSIWWNTGLKGVLIGPFKDGRMLKGNWSRWPVVAYGYSVTEPPFHRASVNHFQDMLAHLRELRRRKYCRIGLCLPKNIDSKTGGKLHAAYLLDQDLAQEKSPIPILCGADVDSPEFLDQWVRGNKIDVVIAYYEHYQALRELGWDIPEQLGFSLLTKRAFETTTKKICGFDTKADELATHSINFLISLIHEQEYGVSAVPRAYMISGEFSEGKTLR